MAEFNLRADTVDVEQIMRQIRARIREKRGVDYTEEQIQELAKIRLEKFLDPKGVRSDLLDQFRQTAQLDIPPTYEFDDQTLIRSGNPLIAFFRRLLQPILKLFFSPNPLVHALHVQTQINKYLLERAQRDVLVYEVMHNLVVEMTRTGIEVKNMQMRVESVASRLDFNERRARALEAVVQYRSDAVSERPAMRDGRQAKQGDSARQSWQGDQNRPADQGRQGDQAMRNGGTEGPSAVDPITGGESLRSRRRRRRRGRRSGPGFQGTSGDERRVPSDVEGPVTSDELEQGAGSDERTTTTDEQATATTSDERRASATSYERSAPSDEQPAAASGEHDSDHDSGSQDPE